HRDEQDGLGPEPGVEDGVEPNASVPDRVGDQVEDETREEEERQDRQDGHADADPAQSVTEPGRPVVGTADPHAAWPRAAGASTRGLPERHRLALRLLVVAVLRTILVACAFAGVGRL